MRVDNLLKIVPFLDFKSKDDFYYLQILQRKKENPQLGSNSRVIKNYYITSVKYLADHYEEIKELCIQFNARASIRLNVRSYEKVAYKAMVNIANSMANREFSFIKKSYDRAVGTGHNESKGNSKWILDLDKRYSNEDFKNLKSLIGDSFITQVPSKSGLHLISHPFDARELKELYPEIEIHKDNPTNLFIP